MPTFVHPLLLWGLTIAAVPVLIHLINMLRHRRVPWAAMEFLRVSQKRHRRWVIFKQLLLLLLRMLAVAAVVLIVAQPLLEHQWSSLFGGLKTHHVILLDDSYSMSDRWADTSAFAEGKRVVERIGAEAVRQTQPQLFTLLRFSRRGRAQKPPPPDFLHRRVDNGFTAELDKTLKNLEVSQTDAGPAAPLESLQELLGDRKDQRRILYLISDFRTRQWNDPTEVKKLLAQWQADDGEIYLINCVDRARPNLAIASLRPEEGIRAAGVPWFMKVAVTNFSSALVRDVTVILSKDRDTLPVANLAEIPPGRTATERFQVSFTTAGWHQITAELASDAVAADNRRFYTLRLPADLPILLVDGDAQARDAKYVSWQFAPGRSVRTGLRPAIETPRYLTLKPLGEYAAVNLTNIERLDVTAVQALENYVAEGGGVAFFLGELSSNRFFNDQLYRDGKGLFPLPLKGPTALLVDRLNRAPDVRPSDHFLFRIFQKQRNTFLPALHVERYFASADDWQPPADGSVRVLARLRDGAPLVVEKEFGKGRVVAFLTTAAPTWNNWARNPGFVVFLDLQAYLAQSRAKEESRLVGMPLELIFDPARYQPMVQFIPPQESAAPPITTDAVITPEGKLAATLAETPHSGFYEVKLTRSNGVSVVRRYAYNVDPAEGNLATQDQTALADQLKGLNYQYAQASQFRMEEDDLHGYNLSELILYLLILLLIGEQILAWSASYHPPALRNPAVGGAR